MACRPISGGQLSCATSSYNDHDPACPCPVTVLHTVCCALREGDTDMRSYLSELPGYIWLRAEETSRRQEAPSSSRPPSDAQHLCMVSWDYAGQASHHSSSTRDAHELSRTDLPQLHTWTFPGPCDIQELSRRVQPQGVHREHV